MLPRPLAFVAALALSGVTGAVVALLPASASHDSASGASQEAVAGASVPAARTGGDAGSPPPASAGSTGSPPGTGAFVAFADAAGTPDLAADARRTGLRRYGLGHVVAGAASCAPAWAGKGRAPGMAWARQALAGLRAAGAGAGLVFGGPGGRELAAACADHEDLAAAYLGLVTALEPVFLDFEILDGADRATVVRRARALRAVQQTHPVPAGFTLTLHPYGLTARDAEMLRLTRDHGVEITTVNLLAPIEPRDGGGLRWVAAAVRAAREQIAASGHAPARLALTPVPTGPAALSEAEARRLVSFAARNDLAWLSLRGPDLAPAASRVLWGAPA